MADEQKFGIGYQGSLGFWGRQGNSLPWWNQDMSDAGQSMYMDPQTGLQTGTMPKELLAQRKKAEETARKARGGFMSQLGLAFETVAGATDEVLSNIPGWGVTKDVGSFVGKTLWYPVDKIATGAYWLYSEAISQPLSTLIIQGAKAEVEGAKNGTGAAWKEFFTGDWTDSYDEAEKVSPGQAFMNYENTMEALDEGTVLSGALGSGGSAMSQKQKEAVERNTERFLYDNEYWRDRQGWKYTIGSGALDFMIAIGADPAYAGLKAISAGTKAARTIKGAETGAQASRSISGVNILAEKAGQKIGGAFSKTAEDLSRSDRMNDFFDWSVGKSSAEIAQHPIWGTGRRANPERYRLSEMFAGAEREEMPLMFRFAAGDSDAATSLVQRNEALLAKMGKVNESRVLVDSVKLKPEMLQNFIAEEKAGLGSPLAEPGIMGTSAGYSKTGELMEPPFPRPTEPGPRQKGWDATYGHLVDQAKVYRSAATQVLALQNGVRPMKGAAATSQADLLMAEQWRAGQLDTMNRQLDDLMAKNRYYMDALGGDIARVEDFSPGRSNPFGSMSELYRRGPLTVSSGEKLADKRITRMSTGIDQYGKVATEKQLAKGGKFAGRVQTDAGFVSRTLRNGFYSPTIRMVNSLTDRLPSTFIDHNAEDAFERVSEMLKRVPNLDAEVRLGMVRSYAQAGDKLARADVLDNIHKGIIEHMALKYDLNPKAADQIAMMIKNGQISTLSELTGQAPKSNVFSAADNASMAGQQPGKRADMVEDGEGWVVAPLAKTQLQAAQPLMDVNELERWFKRNSGTVKSLMQSGMDELSAVGTVADSLNTLWKAATLLRPGYVLRSMSEEQVASAVKFGVISSTFDSLRGGTNFVLNRKSQLQAMVGRGSYASTLKPGKGRVRIIDDEGRAAAESLIAKGEEGVSLERINVSKAWPLIDSRLTQERTAIKELEELIKSEKAAKSPDAELLAQFEERMADHQNTVQEFGDYARAVLSEATDSKGRRLGEGVFEHRGQTIPQAFSSKWENPIPRDQITSAHAMETLFARSEAIETNRLMRTGSWKVIEPDAANPTQAALHMEYWLRGLNRQFGQDDLFRLVAEDPTLAKAKSWLKSPQGKYHRNSLGPAGADTENLLANIKSTLDQYAPPATGLQQKIAKGEEITEQEIRAVMHPEDFPPVHGEEFLSLTRKGRFQSASAAIDRIIEKGFKALGTVPNDVMARQPIYLRAQEARMRQLLDQEIGYRKEIGADELIDMKTMNALLEKSDKMARKDISQVVYDPTRTTATEALRFVAPFMSAHMDGLQRWAGLLKESPEYLSRGAQIYNAPVAANLVTDSQGNHVDQKGYATITDPTTGEVIERKFIPMDERVLNLRIPDGTKNVRGKTSVPIRISSLNTILPGDPWFNPGTGPYAQIAASVVAKKAPGVGDFLQWSKVLPYGPTESWYDPMLPTYMRDAWNAFTAGDADNVAYQEAYLQEYQRQMGEYAMGGDPPDMDEVAKNAKSFMMLDAFTNWFMPARNQATPLTGSPYQFFVDQYKVMQEIDPKEAKTKFFQKYGADYFAFTASLSESMGVQASLSADHVATQYADLIAEDPDLAPLIVGDVYNKGPFSMSVYRKQMDQLLGGERVRQKLTAEQAIAENDKALGWELYNREVGKVDAAMIRSGFKSYNEKGAEPLSALKQLLVQRIAEGNDAWYEDYGTTNTTKLPLRIKAMERLLKDERIASDPMRNDLNGLRYYLEVRGQLQKALRDRGSKSLSFDLDGKPMGENADIGVALKSVQLSLVNNNLEFADVFHRYLENDDLR